MDKNWRFLLSRHSDLKTPYLGTGLGHFLVSRRFRASSFLRQRVLSAILESQGTRFTETRPAIMGTVLTTPGMGSFRSGGGLSSCSFRDYKNSPYLGHSSNWHRFVPSKVPKRSRCEPWGMFEYPNHENDTWSFLSALFCAQISVGKGRT